MLQRDGFIEEIVNAIKKGEDIYFLSADFGAAALDELRRDYPQNFIHCGISEQNMIDVATGLALEGKKVFCYAMAPFISMRALEQIKCGPGIMNLFIICRCWHWLCRFRTNTLCHRRICLPSFYHRCKNFYLCRYTNSKRFSKVFYQKSTIRICEIR